MYNFIDVNEVSEAVVLPSEALNINGKFIENLIPGYRTLSVEGREALSQELNTFETGIRDGSKLKSRRYPERELTIKYQIKAASNEEFRDAYNKLGGILNVQDAVLIFNDEPDKFFTGTPETIQPVEPGRNSVTGEFTILCADPFKYSVLEYEAEANLDESSVVVDYNGTHEAFPVLSANFFEENEIGEDGVHYVTLSGSGDCGYVAFFNDNEKIIQLGNPDEVDGTHSIPKSQTLVNSIFESNAMCGIVADAMWKKNDGLVSDNSVVQNGTLGAGFSLEQLTKGTAWFVKATNYGSGAGWHGATATRVIPEDQSGEIGAKYCTLSFCNKLSIGNSKDAIKETGSFQVMLISGSGSERKVVAGCNIFKGGSGKKANVRFYVGGKITETVQVDVSHANKLFTANKAQTITKSGNSVTFDIGGIKRTYRDADIEEEWITEVTIAFLQWGTKTPLSYNGLHSIKFVKNNCNTWLDIPNKFTANDVVEADCKNGEIFLNGVLTPALGALGNDWEDFCLKPGLNRIGFAYSDWVQAGFEPKIKVRYREVFV